MTRPLRSNFPRGSYLWSVRNAHWRALGIPEEDCEKPKIAIVNSSSELAACFSHLDRVAVEVKAAIRAAGGVPFEIRTAAPSDFITGAGARGAYMLAARDLVTNDIEVAVEGAQLDGMVCLTSCDKTVPGQLMAAARLNIPTLLVPCGYQPSGEYKGHHMDIEEVFIGAMHAVTGNLPVEELVGMSREAIRGPGVCSGLGTANSMHIVCEALGLALPGSAPVAALSPKMMADVRAAGTRIVQMVLDDLKPRDVLTHGAFVNAVRAVLSIGGSLNTAKHLQAVATEGECGVDVYGLFESLGPTTPVLAGVRPIGSDSIEAFEAAGGCRALMKQLEPLLDTNALTVTGATVADNLRNIDVADAEVIRPIGRPVAPLPAIVLLRGNLAPESGLIKTGIVERKVRRFTGPAVCFWTSDAAIAALKKGEIVPGQVVVMRGAGACGGPAMGGGASRIVFAIDGAGLGDQVALLTDGHLSGLVCKGLVVAEVSPEAALGGPLALVRDGDSITIDLDARRLDIALTDAELQARRADWQAPPPVHDTGWLQQYRRNVGPLSKGAVLVRTERPRPPG
ncbi:MULTISPECIES: dihydroxy-acid dehydratase [Variovorax]|jgi:dihydroxy-acid dehydratase|uniref:dihydroxy-acid dehydratase n=1 Tax=Variovorax TaxID=34072 RepID=UPI00086C3172|nr:MULTISPECIES: dihydroxy-acid dehydratase [Variovorax]MBN8757657.1 dihydroxy-acid dehydratase [Variovorax sp.]ODU14234.1 MAG: dihydroxy-acid dehydratase [Variovorax sp. SCN 67-85]ODV25613.1 MAG: dihydroxy-acid dehydratase [Variovorax sp. SCN 67-20]OJZ08747.1 MAG: dihydroxy-acid dehydratase [Variovorax sp. 67-131]UKI11135.1 dihydroxy-acid dehydratase [Variovorax paradoxus]